MENLILTRLNGVLSTAKRLSSISPWRLLWQSGWIRTFILRHLPKLEREMRVSWGSISWTYLMAARCGMPGC